MRLIASATPIASAVVVAHAAPAMPQPRRKMKISLSTAFEPSTTRLIASGMRVRPMPLK